VFMLLLLEQVNIIKKAFPRKPRKCCKKKML